jgi:hypothetical protein
MNTPRVPALPLGRVLAEPNVSTAPHTPVPPPNDAAPTARPPAPDPRPPPLEYARPRPMVRAPGPKPPPLPFAGPEEHTLIGLSPVLSAQKSRGDAGYRKPETLAELLAAKDAELANARAELEAERRKPAPSPSLVPPADVERYERKLERRAHKLPGDGSLKPLVLKLVATLTGLAAALTVTVQLANAWLEPRIKNVEAKQSAQAETLKPLPAAAASADKSADACRDWARAYDDYNRQVLAKAGIIIPERENAPPVKPIELDQTPLPRSGRITGAPLIRIKTKPPDLP